MRRKRISAGGLPKKANLQWVPCTPVKAEAVADKSPTTTPAPDGRQPRLPSEDSPYVRAKHVQLVDKDLSKAIPLFWAALNSGDRVDSALKDMAFVMKQLNRAEEAIEAIKSFRHRCSAEAQENLDNVLLGLYKRCGRTKDEIELLNVKLKMIDNCLACGGRTTKVVRSQGKKIYISLNREKSRLVGSLAWVYMQSDDYKEAERLYRKSLALDPNISKQCNLATCLMKAGKVEEAKALLQSIKKPSPNRRTRSYLESLKRCTELFSALESQTNLLPVPEEVEQEEKMTLISTNTRHVGSSTSISPDEREDKGSDLENSSSSQLANGYSLSFGSICLGDLSPPSCSQNLSNHVTPPSEIRKGRLAHCHVNKGSFTDVCRRRLMDSSPRAFLSPVPAVGNERLEPRKEIEKSREVKDDNVMAEVAQESQNPVGIILQAKATRGSTNSLKATEDENLHLSSRKLTKRMMKRAMKRAARASLSACQREKEEKSQISSNASVTSNNGTKTEAENSSIALTTAPEKLSGGGLSVCTDMIYEQGSDLSTDTNLHVEKIQVKSPKNDESHNSNSSSVEEKIEAPLISNRTWADMVEEEEESISNENEDNNAAFDHPSRSCKDLKPTVPLWQPKTRKHFWMKMLAQTAKVD
ncbi:uncharacterized protein [Typha angustifolia]|uniref:uncharacterized protein n=1 Tax=Typha angustifolia TaxID=59011 RepID=UPI003C2D485F